MTISNPVDRKKIRDALMEISNCLTRVEGERDTIKNVISDLSENYQLPKRTVRRMAKAFHKQDFAKEQQEFFEFEHIYQEVTSG